jgi:hypothetical protein
MELSNQLSPENLHCDGEISPEEANEKYIRLMRLWREGERKVGRSVTEKEIWLHD